MRKPDIPQSIITRRSFREAFNSPWGGCIAALVAALLFVAYLILSGCGSLGPNLGKIVHGATVTIVLGEMDTSPDALAASAAVFEGVLQAKRRRGVTDCVGYPAQPVAHWRPAIGQPWRTAGPLVDPAVIDPRQRWRGMPASGNIYPYSGRQNERGYQNAEALWLAWTVLRAGGPNLVGLSPANCNGIPSSQEAVDAAFSLPEGHPAFALGTISASWRVQGMIATVTVRAPPYGAGLDSIDWGDGSRDSLLSHAYVRAGSYRVKASAIDAGGILRVATGTLAISSDPPAPGLSWRCSDGAGRAGWFRPGVNSTGSFHPLPGVGVRCEEG